MDSVSNKISLDIQKTGTQVFLSAIRGDTKRHIVISLVDGGAPYSVRGIGEAIFTGVKADGKFLYNDCAIDQDSNTIVYEFTEQTAAASGVVNCQIKLVGADGGIISTPTFGIIVADTLYSEQPIVESSLEFNALTAFMADVEKRFGDINAKLEQSSASYISYIDLPSSKWQGSDSLYSQVVSIAGVTENSRVDINPSVEQLAVFYQKDITFITENEDGVVTVYCIGQKPANDYTMQVTITEVVANG